MKSHLNKIFGGYTSQSWEGYNIYKNDNSAFLFSLSDKKIFKCNSRKSIYCNNNFGPVFGNGHDLLISDRCN